MANNELVNPMDSEELSDYIIIVLNHLDKITDISSMDELIELLEFSPDGIKLYSKVLQDCKKFYTDNKRFPDINYIISLHNILVHKKDCPFSLDILIKLKKELIRHKQISEVKNAIDKNDISKVRDILRQDVDVTKPKLLGMEDIFDVYERQELMPRGVMIGIPEVDHYLKGFDYGTLNVIGAPPQSFKCVVEGTRIHTSLGYVRIENIPHGELNSEGFGICNIKVRDNCTTSHFYKGGFKDTITIKSPYFELTGTPIHPIKVLGEEGVVWKQLKDLKINDYICLDRKKNILFSNEVVKPNFLKHCNDEDFGYIIGYLYGDGSFGKDIFSITGTLDNLNIINSITGLESNIVKDERRKDTHSLRFTKSQSRELEELGLIGKADTKEIPEWVYNTNEEFIKGFLSGIFEADGSFKGACTLNIKSESLIKSVRDLLNLFGVFPSINKYDFDYTYKENTRREFIYRLEIARGDFIKLNLFNLRGSKGVQVLDLIQEYGNIANSLEIPYVNKYKSIIKKVTDKYLSDKNYKHYRDNRKFFVMYETCRGWKRNKHFGEKSWNDLKHFINLEEATELDYDLTNYYFKPIESIEEGKGEVFDLSVPETHTFTANGIVNHNTTFAISTAYTASYREGKKVLFITLEVVPRNVLYNIVSRHSYEMYGKQGAIPAVDLKKTLLLEDSKEKFKEVKDNFLQTCKGDLRIAGVNDLEEYSMEYIEAFILRMRDEMGGLDLVYVDYLNLFKNKIPPKLKLDQYQALNYYVDTLQEIAVKHNLIIVLLAQLKTEAIDKLETIVEKAEKSGTPSSNTKLASSTYFAEANALGRTAMTAMIFHCTTAMRNAKVVNIHIVKNRDFESPDKPLPSPIMPEFFVFGTQGSNFTNCSVLSPSFNNSVSTGTQDINSLADDFIVGEIEDIEMDDNVPTSEIANTEGVTVIEEGVLPNIEDIITLDDLMKEPNDESK